MANRIELKAEELRELAQVPLLPEKVRLIDEYSIDDYGRVFHYEDKIYRGVFPKSAAIVKSYFDSGLIDSLHRKGLIPETKPTIYTLPGYQFILNHEKVGNVSYVFEWTFNMVKDAALMVLDLLEELVKHGYSSKDAHPYNILFHNNKPVWVDLTSFIISKNIGHSAILSFIDTLYQPLTLMTLSPTLMRHTTYLPYSNVCTSNIVASMLYKWGFKRMPKGGGNSFLRYLHHFDSIVDKQAFETDPKRIQQGIEAYRRRIESMKMTLNTEWKDYQQNWLGKDGHILIPNGNHRFIKIANIANSLAIRSAVDFSANQGLFPAILSENKAIDKIACLDYDEQAADKMYQLLSRGRLSANCVRKMYPMVVDFTKISNDPPSGIVLSERIKADAVFALAMTHHLLLTQRCRIDKMFDIFSRFTRRYLFVEFMPMGLFSSNTNTAPPTPPYYTEEWFTKGLEKKFRILLRQELSTNRVLFVAEVKSQNS